SSSVAFRVIILLLAATAGLYVLRDKILPRGPSQDLPKTKSSTYAPSPERERAADEELNRIIAIEDEDLDFDRAEEVLASWRNYLREYAGTAGETQARDRQTRYVGGLEARARQEYEEIQQREKEPR